MPTDTSPAAPNFAGFWRRAGAFIVDVLILGLLGLSLHFWAGTWLVRLDAWGPLLGFALALAYFGLLNSRLGQGQTLGKRLLAIRVVDGAGQFLTPSRALLRFVPLGLPWFLNSLQGYLGWLLWPWNALLTLLTLGLGSVLLYLLIFNRSTRRSLHDLLVGSQVLRATGGSIAPATPLWAGHLAVCAVLALLSLGLPSLLERALSGPALRDVRAIQQRLEAEPDVARAAVLIGARRHLAAQSSPHDFSFLSLAVHSRHADLANPRRAQQLAQAALAVSPGLRSVNQVQVELIYGYNIGIFSSHQSVSYTRTPAVWLAPVVPVALPTAQP